MSDEHSSVMIECFAVSTSSAYLGRSRKYLFPLFLALSAHSNKAAGINSSCSVRSSIWPPSHLYFTGRFLWNFAFCYTGTRTAFSLACIYRCVISARSKEYVGDADGVRRTGTPTARPITQLGISPPCTSLFDRLRHLVTVDIAGCLFLKGWIVF